MYIRRQLSLTVIYFYTWRMMLISLFTGVLAIFVYDYLGWKWVVIPWLLIPFNFIVSCVFMLMEYTGDVSENPFEGLLNDVPLISIVMNIEIDLKDMLGEKDLSEKIEPYFVTLF